MQPGLKMRGARLVHEVPEPAKQVSPHDELMGRRLHQTHIRRLQAQRCLRSIPCADRQVDHPGSAVAVQKFFPHSAGVAMVRERFLNGLGALRFFRALWACAAHAACHFCRLRVDIPFQFPRQEIVMFTCERQTPSRCCGWSQGTVVGVLLPCQERHWRRRTASL